MTLALAAVSGHRQKVSAAAASSAALSVVETKAAPVVAEKAPAATEKTEKNAPEAKK